MPYSETHRPTKGHHTPTQALWYRRETRVGDAQQDRPPRQRHEIKPRVPAQAKSTGQRITCKDSLAMPTDHSSLRVTRNETTYMIPDLAT